MLKRIQSGSNYDSSPTSPTYHSSNSSSSNTSSSSINREKQQEQFRKILSVLIKKPGNGECADCTEARPVWCSATFGTFICLRCAGIHRSLGSHISFVRSAEMDKWDEKHVKIMQLMGNERAKQYFENNMPEDRKKPLRIDSTQTVEQYIKDKYVNLKYVPKKDDGKKMTFKEFLELAKQHDETNGDADESLPQKKKKTSEKSATEKSEKTTVKKKKVKKATTTSGEETKSSEPTVEDLIGITTMSSPTVQNLTSIDDFMSDIVSPITPMNEIPTPVSATENTLLGFLSDKFSLIDLNSPNNGTSVTTATTSNIAVASTRDAISTSTATTTGSSETKKKTVKKSAVKPIKTTKKQESTDHDDDEDSEDEYDAIFQKTTTQKATAQDEKKNAILDLWGH